MRLFRGSCASALWGGYCVAVEAVPSWHLWSQPLLLFWACLLLWRSRAEIGQGARTPRLLVALCALAPLLVAFLLPQSSYHFAGHEGTYGSALLGRAPPLDDLNSYGTMPVPMGLSWLLGSVAPGSYQQQLWLALNRVSMAVVLWMMGLLVCTAAREVSLGRDDARHHRAGWCVVWLGMMSVPLAAWSATGYFVTPALAMAAAALVLAARGQASLAALWAVLALGSRMELGLVLPAVLVIVPLSAWKKEFLGSGRPRVILAALALALECLLLANKSARLPVDSFTLDASIVWENLLNVPLGGALFAPLTLLAAAAAVALARLGLQQHRLLLVLAVGFFVALLQPMLLIDVGARHFLPAMLFGLPLLALSLSSLLAKGLRSQPSSLVFGVVLVALIVAPTLGDYADLRHRYVAGQDGYLNRWVARADGGIRGTIDELLEPSGCYVVMPGGEQTWRGASPGGDVREVHNSVLALREGQCVRWAVAGEVEFSGAASAERVDRAIHTLGLVAIGWLDPPPLGERPWLLFGAEPVRP